MTVTHPSSGPFEPGPDDRCPTGARRTVSCEVAQAATVAHAVAVNETTVGTIDPDAELVLRWQEGDLGAFEALVRRHERRVFSLVFRMLGSRQEAEDVAQEAFLALHRHGRRFRGEARFSTFVYRVAANAALNRRRSLGRRRAREEALSHRQDAGDDLPSTPRDPEDAASGGEIQARVQAALLGLPKDLRMAVVLYDIEGQSYGEIARVLRIPEGTVKSRIHRARIALRDRLRALAHSESEGVES